jgi:hypothetical protein
MKTPLSFIRLPSAPSRTSRNPAFRTFACFAILLLLLVAGTGCRSTSDPAAGATRYVITGDPAAGDQPRSVSKYNLENSARIALLDRGVQRSVAISSILERYLDDGRLEVIVNVRNRLNRRIEVQISCVFQDELGFPVNDEAPFTRLILTENAQEGVRFVSLSDKARTYTIRIRQSR